MSDKHKKRLTSAKSFVHGEKASGKRSKRASSEETSVAMPTSSYKDLLLSQDANTIEVNWESPKISQGRQSRVRSTADLLPDLSPTDKEVTPPSCSPLIQIRYRSPLNSQLMSTPLRHQGEKNGAYKTMNMRPNKDDVLQHVIDAISQCHNNELAKQTQPGTNGPLRIDRVINESIEIRNGITVGHVSAFLSSSKESQSLHSTKDFLSTVNPITKKDVVRVKTQLDSSTGENDDWTDDEFFLSEAVLEATQAPANISPAIFRSDNSHSVSPRCIKRKSRLPSVPELGFKKSGRYTFALEDGKASKTSIRPQRSVLPCKSPFLPPPVNRCVVEKSGFFEDKEAPGDMSLTDELLATIADPDFFLDTQVDNKLPVDMGCRSLGNDSEVVGPSKSRQDENAGKATVKDEPAVAEIFGDVNDDDLTEQQLMEMLDTVESQVTPPIEPVSGSSSVSVAASNVSSMFTKILPASATVNSRNNVVATEKNTNFRKVASFNVSSTMQASARQVPLCDNRNTQNKNKFTTPCANGNSSKSFPVKVESLSSKPGAVDPVKIRNVSTPSCNMTSSVQAFVRSNEMNERSFTSVTRLNVKSLSCDSVVVPCETDCNKFGTSSQSQTTGGRDQKCSAAEIEQKKREALRRRELKLMRKQ